LAPNSLSVGTPPHTPLGSLQRSSDPRAIFKGPTSTRREGRGRRGEEKLKGEGERMWREGFDPLHVLQ